MKKNEILILCAAAAVAFLFLGKKAGAGGANNAPFVGANTPSGKNTALDSIFGSIQATLGNGNILDTQTGVIFDPLTGNYTDIYTGAIIY